MNKKSFGKLFIIVLLFCCSFVTQGSEKPDSLLLLKQLNSSAIPISLDSAVNDEQFSFLRQSIKESRIVGLGEATHGTHEFMKGHTEIIKYLISNMNFKVIVFESGYGGTDLLNKYITGENVSINKAIYNIGFINFMNYDILSFVKWLREYNSNKTNEEQVKVYGCDSQFVRYVIDDLMKFLQQHQSLSSELKSRLIDLRDKLSETSKKEKLKTLKLLQSSFNPLIANEEIKQRMEIVIQCIDVATSSILGSLLKRDRYMAQNCDWLFNANNQRKMVIYAHNMHIAKATDNSMEKLMGQYISQLHPDFFVIGTGFSQGSVGIKRKNDTPAFYKEAINNSYDFFFAKCQYPSYFLDFSLINNTELKTFVSTKSLSRNTGGTLYEDIATNEKLNYRKHVLDKSYDALLFFKDSSPTQKMSVFD